MDRNVKARIMAYATILKRRTEPGRAYGILTGKAVDVLRAILWQFHNAKTGLCFPGYDAIAEAAGCARSTVHRSITMLEDAGLLTWTHRWQRERMPVRGLIDGTTTVRVVRTSNGYVFSEPTGEASPHHRMVTRAGQSTWKTSKSEKPSRTQNQDSYSSMSMQKEAVQSPLGKALERYASLFSSIERPPGAACR